MGTEAEREVVSLEARVTLAQEHAETANQAAKRNERRLEQAAADLEATEGSILASDDYAGAAFKLLVEHGLRLEAAIRSLTSKRPALESGIRAAQEGLTTAETELRQAQHEAELAKHATRRQALDESLLKTAHRWRDGGGGMALAAFEAAAAELRSIGGGRLFSSDILSSSRGVCEMAQRGLDKAKTYEREGRQWW